MEKLRIMFGVGPSEDFPVDAPVQVQLGPPGRHTALSRTLQERTIPADQVVRFVSEWKQAVRVKQGQFWRVVHGAVIVDVE